MAAHDANEGASGTNYTSELYVAASVADANDTEAIRRDVIATLTRYPVDVQIASLIQHVAARGLRAVDVTDLSESDLRRLRKKHVCYARETAARTHMFTMRQNESVQHMKRRVGGSTVKVMVIPETCRPVVLYFYGRASGFISGYMPFNSEDLQI